MATHTQPGNSPAFSIADGGIVRINPGRDFCADIGFKFHGIIYRTIQVPAILAFRRNDDELVLIGVFDNIREPGHIVAVPAAIAM